MSGKVLQLILPQWQGGNNPNYIIGSRLLSCIVPKRNHIETVAIAVNEEVQYPLKVEKGIEGLSILKKQFKETNLVLETKQPSKVIVLGGDCSVSQSPFNYLSKKYGKDLGVLWLDAHPDVATIENSIRAHEMVLENLIEGKGNELADLVSHPIERSHVMLAGLIYSDLRERDQNVNFQDLAYATPSELLKDSSVILKWINDNKIKYLAVHLDLDVLDPNDFRSIYPAEPFLKNFDAAIGELKLSDIVNILNTVEKNSEIVGLTIAEHMPWDAIRLHDALSQISIFNK